MNVVVAGGSGFIGRALVSRLIEEGHQATVLSRSDEAVGTARVVRWDGRSSGPWESVLDDADAIINLTGSSINQRWDDAGKASILNSRVNSCRALGEALGRRTNGPKVWIQGSAVGFYGDTGENEVDEQSPVGTGFLAETCQAWERSAATYRQGLRQSFVRTGIVLGKGGGALQPLFALSRAFLGGQAGDGRQFMPWIHLDDIVGIFSHVLESEFKGVVNGVQPNPARNSEVMASIRRALGRPWSPPAPVFGIKIAEAVLGIPSELALVSQRVTTRVLPGRYEFKYPDLDGAVRACV